MNRKGLAAAFPFAPQTSKESSLYLLAAALRHQHISPRSTNPPQSSSAYKCLRRSSSPAGTPEAAGVESSRAPLSPQEGRAPTVFCKRRCPTRSLSGRKPGEVLKVLREGSSWAGPACSPNATCLKSNPRTVAGLFLEVEPASAFPWKAKTRSSHEI